MISLNRSLHVSVLLSLILVLGTVLSGCGTVEVEEIATETTKPSALPSDTPVSTSTLTPTPTETATLTPTVTVTRTATPNLRATLESKQTATQAAIDARVAGELIKYDIDPALGHVAWTMKAPVVLDGAGYALGWYQPIQELGVLKDFVVQSEILWDTSGGLSGCGYIFRARADWDLEIGDFYNFYMMRLQFAPIWMVDYYEDGRWHYTLPGRAGVTSSNILDTKMSKNVVTLVVRGETFIVFINGIKERAIENNKLTEGRLAFEVIQESGTSYCKFENGWVWEFDE